MLDLCASQIIWQLLVFPHPGHTPTQRKTRNVLLCSLWSEYVAGLSFSLLTLKYQVGVSPKWYSWSCPISWQSTWIFEIPGEQRPITILLHRNETGSSNCAPSHCKKTEWYEGPRNMNFCSGKVHQNCDASCWRKFVIFRYSLWRELVHCTPSLLQVAVFLAK